MKMAEATKGLNQVTTTIFQEEGFHFSEEMLVNYKDLGRQMIILHIGAPVIHASVSWMS